MTKYIIIGIILILIFIIITSIIFRFKKLKRKREEKERLDRKKYQEFLKKQEEKRKERLKIIQKKIKDFTIIVPKKYGWQEFENYLNSKKIKYLYHFTDGSNINSIIDNGGLYSWYYCDQNGIIIPKPGGSQISRDLDMRKNIHNFVRLCFIKNHPMKYVAEKDGRIPNPKVLKISKEVIYWDRTKYSDINAATERITPNIGNTINHLKNINFNVFNREYFDLNEKEKMQYQAEVLVYESIPINYIESINDICRK
jgi:hypothetical protein